MIPSKQSIYNEILSDMEHYQALCVAPSAIVGLTAAEHFETGSRKETYRYIAGILADNGDRWESFTSDQVIRARFPGGMEQMDSPDANIEDLDLIRNVRTHIEQWVKLDLLRIGRPEGPYSETFLITDAFLRLCYTLLLESISTFDCRPA